MAEARTTITCKSAYRSIGDANGISTKTWLIMRECAVHHGIQRLNRNIMNSGWIEATVNKKGLGGRQGRHRGEDGAGISLHSRMRSPGMVRERAHSCERIQKI